MICNALFSGRLSFVFSLLISIRHRLTLTRLARDEPPRLARTGRHYTRRNWAKIPHSLLFYGVLRQDLDQVSPFWFCTEPISERSG